MHGCLFLDPQSTTDDTTASCSSASTHVQMSSNQITRGHSQKRVTAIRAGYQLKGGALSIQKPTSAARSSKTLKREIIMIVSALRRGNTTTELGILPGGGRGGGEEGGGGISADGRPNRIRLCAPLNYNSKSRLKVFIHSRDPLTEGYGLPIQFHHRAVLSVR